MHKHIFKKCVRTNVFVYLQIYTFHPMQFLHICTHMHMCIYVSIPIDEK